MHSPTARSERQFRDLSWSRRHGVSIVTVVLINLLVLQPFR
jgi:hypothetical protein